MKRILSALLALLLTVSLSGCRRRVMADGVQTIHRTVTQPTPVPMEEAGQQIPTDAPDENSEKSKKETDPDGQAVDEAVAAEGGEETPDAPEADAAGELLTVTLDAAGGECEVKTVTVRSGGVYGELPTPVKSGETFQGWFLQPEGGEPVRAVTAVWKETDHTLYAQWTTQTEFTLTFDPNGGRISPYSARKQVYAGDVYGTLPEPMRSGYAFLGWYTTPEDGTQIQPSDLVCLYEDQTVYAHWEYDPLAYWSFVLENTAQKIFTCQEVPVYLEMEADRTTMPYCPLITNTGAKNIAQDLESGIVSDDWIREKNPGVIVKLTGTMSTAEATQTAVERRFPGTKVYVFPEAAVDGSEAEQLYYQLCLASICYPAWYYDIDLDAAAAELGVEGAIYS